MKTFVVVLMSIMCSTIFAQAWEVFKVIYENDTHHFATNYANSGIEQWKLDAWGDNFQPAKEHALTEANDQLRVLCTNIKGEMVAGTHQIVAHRLIDFAPEDESNIDAIEIRTKVYQLCLVDMRKKSAWNRMMIKAKAGVESLDYQYMVDVLEKIGKHQPLYKLYHISPDRLYMGIDKSLTYRIGIAKWKAKTKRASALTCKRIRGRVVTEINQDRYNLPDYLDFEYGVLKQYRDYVTQSRYKAVQVSSGHYVYLKHITQCLVDTKRLGVGGADWNRILFNSDVQSIGKALERYDLEQLGIPEKNWYINLREVGAVKVKAQ